MRIGVLTSRGHGDPVTDDLVATLASGGHEAVLLAHDASELDGVDALVVAEAPPGVEASGLDAPVRFGLAGQVAVGITRGMPVLGLGPGLGLLCGGGILPGVWTAPSAPAGAARTATVLTRRTSWTTTLEPGSTVALRDLGRWSPPGPGVGEVVLSVGEEAVGVGNDDGNVLGVTGLLDVSDGGPGLTAAVVAMLGRVPLDGYSITDRAGTGRPGGGTHG